MKIVKMVTILFIISNMFYSCTTKEGGWDDTIELSQKEVNFNSSADSVTITTKGDGWWISDIRLNNELINLESVNTTEPVFDIIESEFIVSKKSKTEMQIKIIENTNLTERELIIGVQDGNYFDNITIIQKGK